jgi:uncharacterized membrane protein
MDFGRVLRHLAMPRWRADRAFTRQALLAIEQAIQASEAVHAGEIRFVAEAALDGAPLFRGQSARERAIDLFSQLRIWDTELNNGVLIYLLLADRDVEIVADRGIHDRVGAREWENICHAMELAFKRGNFEGGVVNGVQAVTQQLMKYFPAAGAGRNELHDGPVML